MKKHLSRIYRTLAFCMAVLMLLPGCTGGKSVSDDDSYTESEVSEIQDIGETEKQVVFNGITEMDFEGRDINIYTEGWWDYNPLAIDDIYAESEDGEVLNDAVVNRNRTINEAFNCNVAQSNFGHYEGAAAALRNAVMADDDIYDLCIIRALNFLSGITNQYFIDMNSLKINFNNEWWNQNILSLLSLKGKNYGVVSDLTISDEKSIYCTYYNKKMVVDYNFENMNSVFSKGTWTYEKMFSMAKAVANDLNGDGIMDEKDMP